MRKNMLANLLFGVFLVLISMVSFAVMAANGAVEMKSFTLNMSDQAIEAGVWQWIGDHWEFVAFAVSEVAVFLPTKANGIIHSILLILGRLFGKK
jgi:hypothetical protein